MLPSTTTLLALLCFGVGVIGDASANYTEQLLSSGTIKLGDWQEAYDKAYALGMLHFGSLLCLHITHMTQSRL